MRPDILDADEQDNRGAPVLALATLLPCRTLCYLLLLLLSLPVYVLTQKVACHRLTNAPAWLHSMLLSDVCLL